MQRFCSRQNVEILFAFVLASLIASSLLQRFVGHVMEYPNIDFYDYYFTAQLVHDSPHANLYYGATVGNPTATTPPPDSELVRRATRAGLPDIEYYLYPPLLADLFVPLTFLTPAKAAALWRVLNLLFVFATACLILRLLRAPMLSTTLLVIAIGIYSSWPFLEAMAVGQISIAIMVLWVIAIVAYTEDFVVLSAAALALATALKLTPLAVLPLFLIWKEKKWLASYLASGAALVLLMVSLNGLPNLEKCIHVLSAMTEGMVAMQNKSIAAMLAWLYYGRLFTLDTAHQLAAHGLPRGLLRVSQFAVLSFYALSVWLVWGRRAQKDLLWRATTIAVCATGTAVMSPVSWRHGYCAALILLALLWAQALRGFTTNLRLLLLTVASFSVGSVFFDLAAQTSLPQFAKIFFASTWTLSCILLCLEVLWKGIPSSPAWPSEPSDPLPKSLSVSRITY